MPVSTMAYKSWVASGLLGIDLNEAVRDPDPDELLQGHDLALPEQVQDPGMDLNEPVRQRRHPVADVYLNNPDEWNDVEKHVFDLNHPVFSDAIEEDTDEEKAPCEPDLNLNAQGHVVLPDLNEIPAGVRSTRKNYSDDTKRAVYAMLLKGSRGGRLPFGLTLQVSLAMDVSLRCVQRIWNEGQKGGGMHAVVSKRANCGRKRIEVSPEAITAIPLNGRTTLENVARHLGMAKSTVFRRVKEGRIERHSIPILPLRNEDKRSRAQYCLDMLEIQCSSSSRLKSNYNMTNKDKNLFQRTKPNQKFYGAPGEQILKEQ